MTRWFALALTLFLAGPVAAQTQAPGTWLKLTFPVQTLYQPILGGNQSIAPGLTGAAFSNCPRPVSSDAAGVVRSFSGVVITDQSELLMVGGGHAGHPGNDLEFIDFLASARTFPYAAECPPAYLTTTLAQSYAVGATQIRVTSTTGFPTAVPFNVFLGNGPKTTFRVSAIAGTTYTGAATLNDGPASAGAVVSVANAVWRGIKGGAVMTSALSATGKPLVEHVYMNHAWDSTRSRYLIMRGNGLMAYTLPSAEHSEGQWTLLAGNNRTLHEITWGSSGGMIYDPVRDSLWMYVSTAGNGGARGIYEYLFAPDGHIITKRYVRPWPVTEGTCWGCANLITAMYAGERREAILMVTPSSNTSSVPRNQLWRFSLDTEALLRDQSWVPGTPQYDEVFAVDDTRARVLSRVAGKTWVLIQTGAWVHDDNAGGSWSFVAMPGAPDLGWWTFACDENSPYCVGIDGRNQYCGISGACGGLFDVWRYRRP